MLMFGSNLNETTERQAHTATFLYPGEPGDESPPVIKDFNIEKLMAV